MSSKRMLSTAAMLLLLAGCGKHDGNEFLGK